MALADIYISLGGVDFRSRAIRCYDWGDLLKSPPKRGSNRVIAGEPGRLARPRVADEMRVGLPFQINGRFVHPGDAPFTGNSHNNLYTLLAALRVVCDVGTVQQLRLVGAMAASVDCIVEEMGPPTFQADDIVSLVVDVTLPGGAVTYSAS